MSALQIVSIGYKNKHTTCSFQSGGEGRSRYDTIADIHGLAMIQAHDGPNFLSWHRLYLLM